jgi:NAD(P)-dependent dehydrogenase (short-subunit alcohol dehydrogenase family)
MKTILITGANGAVGSATSLEIAKSGATTILAGRNKQKLETLQKDIIQKSGNKNVDILLMDLSDSSSVMNAVNEFKTKYQKLDALINTAAIYKGKRETNKKGLELMFATNHMGVFTLTNGLLEVLKASGSARVITVAAPSSTKLNFDDLQGQNKFSAFQAFGASKMANLLFTYQLAKKHNADGITAIALHPGLVKSDLVNEMPGLLKFFLGLISTSGEKAAKTLFKLALAPEYKNAGGKFFDFKEKELKSAPFSYDTNAQEKLWKLSESLMT